MNPNLDPDTPASHQLPQSAEWPVTADMPDGVDALRRVLERAGYPSVLHAVAEQAVFLHPRTVAQTHLEPVFPVVRDLKRRGQTEVLADGQEVMYDDNYSPTRAFTWAAGWTAKPKDLQFNHVIADSANHRTYSALWNLCVTPSYLAKATDGHPQVKAALRYRSHQLYGTPADQTPPDAPDGFDDLVWGPVTPPIEDLRATMQARMAKTKEQRTLTIRRIGWLFGDPH